MVRFKSIKKNNLNQTPKLRYSFIIFQIIQLWRYVSSRFFRNSEANASELLENFEEMFPRCQ